jgi:glycosyltransferase involved in cell wall biosynthesis
MSFERRHGLPEPLPPVTSGFHTLADEPAPPRGEAGVSRGRLTILLEGVAARDVESIASLGSLALTVKGGELCVVGNDDAFQPTPSTLGGLRQLLGSTDGDLLLVSDLVRLTPTAFEFLRAGLEADSACATVSLDERAHQPAPGVPPLGIEKPRAGVVLVRRDHLLLALDEASLFRRDDVHLIRRAGEGLAADVLASMDRPGFVHRVVGPDAQGPPVTAPVGRRAVRRSGVHLVLDGRCLAQPLSGTQVQFLGLLGGLVDTGIDAAVLRPHEFHPTVRTEVARFERVVPFLERSRVGRPEVFHRPFQVGSLHELVECLSVGERLVLTHQDMIRDRTPAYSSTFDAWQDYRRATEAALSSADQVGFFSRHAAVDAASDGSIELDRATVVPLGVDHLSARPLPDTVADPLAGRPYVLVVGNAYWHKNRLFSLRLLRWLIEHEAWEGGLVLAGEDPLRGSSVSAERALVGESVVLRDRVVDRGRVSGVEQVALYRGAQLVLFPSLYEGFGLIPFEAASLSTPSVYTYRAAMRELLPDAGALPSFDLDEAGPFVLALLESSTARTRIVQEIAEVAKELTWERTASGYLEVYGRAVASEPRAVSRLLVGVDPSGRRRITEPEARLLDLYRRRRGFRLAVDGIVLAGSLGLRAARRAQRKEP